MKHVSSYFLLLLTAALLVCCRGETPKRIPSTLPNVRGVIKNIKKTAPNGKSETALVLLQAMDGLETQNEQAHIKIDKSTLIEDQRGERMTMQQLREGQEVEAWFEGGMLDSPTQGTVKAIRVNR